jgi:hypothetical protein
MRFGGALIGIAGLTLSVGAMADDLETQARALRLIRETAADICNTIAQEGSSQSLELSGDVKAKLGGAVTKMADLGIEGAGKYRTEEFKGPLQQELARAIKDNANCRLEVLKLLQEKMLGPSQNSAPPPQRAVPRADRCVDADTHWKAANDIGTSAAYRDHLDRFPNCIFSRLARERIKDLASRDLTSGTDARPSSIKGRWKGTIPLGSHGTYGGNMELVPVGEKVTGWVRFNNLGNSGHNALYRITGTYDPSGSMAFGRLAITTDRRGDWCSIGTINVVLLPMGQLQVSVTGQNPRGGTCPSWTEFFVRG